MFLVNLTWLQFFAVFGGISAGVVALYLWDRSKRRVRVPTLRFWTASERPVEASRRRRIKQPLSLLLQLLSIALLLLALAQLRLGSPGQAARDHVLVLDTSAWMAARTQQGALIDEARRAAHSYVHAVPSSDRVMLVRADALATPATAFERNRALLDQAIDESRPGSTALSLAQAVDFARQAQRLQGGRPGEIVYAGAGRVADREADLARADIAGLRVLPVSDAIENCGLRRIGLRRSAADPETWEVLVAVRNYGSRARPVSVGLALNGVPVGIRRMSLAAGQEQDVTFQCRTRAAGHLEAHLAPDDAYPADDRAALDLPAQKPLNVVVYSEDPAELRPVLSDSLVSAVYRQPAEYGTATAADIVIFDRFTPKVGPRIDAIWIEPPPGPAPVRVQANVTNVPVANWRADHPISAGLRAKDMRLDSAEVFAPSSGDAVVAEVDAGPVIVARSERPKYVVLGFHPVRGALRYELTTPLLFANILRWMAPDIFRRWELNAGSAGNVAVPVGTDTDPASIRVVTESGAELPYTFEGGEVRFFAASPGTVRVIAGDREMVYSLILPQLADTKWTPARELARGIPPPVESKAAYIELWPWLAAAGAIVFFAEWMLFGRERYGRVPLPRVRDMRLPRVRATGAV